MGILCRRKTIILQFDAQLEFSIFCGINDPFSVTDRDVEIQKVLTGSQERDGHIALEDIPLDAELSRNG